MRLRPETSKTRYPVFRRLSYERTLVAASTRIAHSGVTTRANEVVQFRKLYDECIPIVSIKRPLLQVFLNECRFERQIRLFLRMRSVDWHMAMQDETDIMFLESR